MKGLCHHCNRHYQRLDRHNKRFHSENKTFDGSICDSAKQEPSLNNAKALILFLCSNNKKHLKKWLKRKASKKSLIQLLDTLIFVKHHVKESRLVSGSAKVALNSQESILKLASPIFIWVQKLIKKFRSVLLQYSSTFYNLLKIL